MPGKSAYRTCAGLAPDIDENPDCSGFKRDRCSYESRLAFADAFAPAKRLQSMREWQNLSDWRGRSHSGRNKPPTDRVALPTRRARGGREGRPAVRTMRLRGKRIKCFLALRAKPIIADKRRSLARRACIVLMAWPLFAASHGERAGQGTPATQQKKHA